MRGDAKKGDIKTQDRKGSLDVEVLKKHGITKENVNVNPSPLTFLDLLLPIHDPDFSGIEDDGRMPYIPKVRQHTNSYACHQQWGGSYGHNATHKPVSDAELVRWTGIPILHGAREGSSGTLYKRWLMSDKNFDQDVSNSMNYSRYKAIKSVFKLNENMTAPKRGQEGYEPCAKYDYIYKVLCFNMNYFTTCPKSWSIPKTRFSPKGEPKSNCFKFFAKTLIAESSALSFAICKASLLNDGSNKRL